jgi:ankyrin repeat protein
VAKVKEALRDGAFVDHRDKHGNTPLMYACSRGRITVIRELLKVHLVHISGRQRLGVAVLFAGI